MSEAAAPSFRLRDMAVNERPQERLEKHGAGALSDTELLAMLLRSGSRNLDVIGLSSRLISEAGSLAGLLSWSEEDFRRMPGIGRIKALQLLTVIEIARRILSEEAGQDPILDTPDKVRSYLLPVARGLDVEKFWVLCLNRKNRLLRRVEATSGTATGSLVHPREVFREAIRNGATAIICAHNHPSGDPTPSRADIAVTRQLKQAGEALDIAMIDHVVVGHAQKDPQGKGYFSFSEAGLV